MEVKMKSSITKLLIFIFICIALVLCNIFASNTSNRENKTTIEKQYECGGSVIYPNQYYQDKTKQLAQFEFIELNYIKNEGNYQLEIYDDQEKILKSELIKSNATENEYSEVVERKYIAQFQMNSSHFFKFIIIQNDVEMYWFNLDVRDFKNINLIKKDKNYFEKAAKLDKESNEYKMMDDTQFLNKSILFDNDDSWLKEVNQNE